MYKKVSINMIKSLKFGEQKICGSRVGTIQAIYYLITHIYGVSKEIDGKTFIFRVNLGM